MTVLINSLLVLCLVVIDVHSLWEEIAGPYDLVMTRFGECDKKVQHNMFTAMKMGKYNRTHLVYSGHFDLGADADDLIKVRLVASNKGTNGRYNNVIDAKYKVCDMIKLFGADIYDSFHKHCNITSSCPQKRWTCEMKNWIVCYNLKNIPALPYGEYRLDIMIYKAPPFKKQELFSCLRFYGTVSPKMEKQPTKNQPEKKE